MTSWMILVPAVTLLMFFGALGAYLFKLSAKKFSLNPFKLIKNYYFILAAIVYSCATLGYVALLRYEDLTIIYPLASIQYIWTTLFGAVLLHEKITKNKIIAIGCILVGVIIITTLR